MRVLHLVNSLNRGGIEMWLLSMLNVVPRTQREMDVCCRGTTVGSLAADAQQAGAKVYHVPFGPWHFGFFRKLQTLLLTGNYDILHNHMGAYSGFPVWIAHHCGIPVITSFHNTASDPQTTLTRQPGIREFRRFYSERSVRYALRKSNHVTGCSAGVVESLSTYLVRSKQEMSILYYGVDVPTLAQQGERLEFRRNLGWPEDAKIVVHVGRFFEQKNHSAVFAVFEQVRRQIPQARLLLIGDGILRGKYEEFARERELNAHVKFLGVRTDVPYLLTHCDLFLMPSLYEGFGLAALEASAASLPVIGTRTPGLMEAVVDGETGLLFDVANIEGMAAAVIRLLRDPVEARRLGNLGRRRVQRTFSTHSSAIQLTSLYDEYYCHAKRALCTGHRR